MSACRRLTWAALTTLLVGVLVSLPAVAGPQAKTKLVSKTSAGDPASGDSDAPSISASGRYAAFQSDAENLPGGASGVDVYIHDRKTGKTRIVSKTSGGELATGVSSRPSISASGRYVAFDSYSSNLPGDDLFFDVYVRDRKTGTTRLVSKTSAGDLAEGNSLRPSISADGRYVAFDSDATNLAGSINPSHQVYVHDRETGKTRLASKTSAGDPGAGGQSVGALLSASGRYVGYESNATNLGGDDSVTDVFVHDRNTGRTRLVSRTSAGDPATGGPSYGGWLSSSGRYVGIESDATNLPGDDSETGAFVRDLKTGKTKLVSKTSAGDPATGGNSFHPFLSGSGRYVAFVSGATNLPGDDSVQDVYVHDRKTGKTKLMSKTSAGAPASGGDSYRPVISSSANYVAFPSNATNLPGDDAFGDIYVRGPLK